MEQVLEKLDKRSRQQLIFTKVLCVLCVVVLVCFLVLMFSVAGAVKEVLAQIEPLKDMAAKAETVFADLETVDFDALNQTIQDLSDVIEPLVKLADFFG